MFSRFSLSRDLIAGSILFIILFWNNSYAENFSAVPMYGSIELHYAHSLKSEDDPDGDGDNKGAKHFPKKWISNKGRVFLFSPKFSAWAAYDEKGQRINTGKASGGKAFCPDLKKACHTPSGVYYVFSKGDKDCKSSIFPIETNGGAPMPYCMMFSSQGDAIHGSNNVPDHNASHGCIRVTPVAAKWLSENFIKIGTKVIIWPY